MDENTKKRNELLNEEKRLRLRLDEIVDELEKTEHSKSHQKQFDEIYEKELKRITCKKRKHNEEEGGEEEEEASNHVKSFVFTLPDTLMLIMDCLESVNDMIALLLTKSIFVKFIRNETFLKFISLRIESHLQKMSDWNAGPHLKLKQTHFLNFGNTKINLSELIQGSSKLNKLSLFKALETAENLNAIFSLTFTYDMTSTDVSSLDKIYLSNKYDKKIVKLTDFLEQSKDGLLFTKKRSSNGTNTTMKNIKKTTFSLAEKNSLFESCHVINKEKSVPLRRYLKSRNYEIYTVYISSNADERIKNYLLGVTIIQRIGIEKFNGRRRGGVISSIVKKLENYVKETQ
jgi:hypothetical protein